MHSRSPQTPSRPYLKYAGGKQRLLPAIRPHLPPGRRLIEPFVGAGSIFLGTDYPAALLADANLDLVAVWTAIKERPKDFVRRASAFFIEQNRSADAYLRIRAEYNGATDSFERAVRFIYLNKFGFNGLYRVNQRGLFNVPYGKPAFLPNFPFDEVAAANAKLSTATLLAGGFAGTMALAGDGDVVYCDPPYSDLDDKRSFTAYTVSGFGRDHHTALTAAALEAVERGATVLISNHLTSLTSDLYCGLEVVTLSTSRSIAASSTHRGSVIEVLAIGRPGLVANAGTVAR